MAESAKDRGMLATVAMLVLVFGVIFLAVRGSAVSDERDEALERQEKVLGKVESLTDERDRALEALRTARREAQARDEQARLAKSVLDEAVRVEVEARTGLRGQLDALNARLDAVRRERDEAQRSRLDLLDRVGGLESTLVAREAELAEARRTIRRLKDPTPVEREETRLASDDPRVRSEAIRTLGTLRSDPAALEALRGALRASRSLAEARAVLTACGDVGGARLAREEAGHGAVTVRCAAALTTADVTVLGRLLDDADPRVRAAAARHAGEAGIATVLDGVRRRRGDADAEVRSAVAIALTRLGAWSDALTLLADKDLRVARSALAGWTAADRAVPEGTRTHPDLAEAVALSRWILSLRAGSE